MNYDLTIKEDRKRFLRRANALMKSQRNNVSLVDESNRTFNQNSYIHVLCRILAADIGTTESYAKQIYFKEMANQDIFCTITKDALTGKMITTTRSTTELTIPEMRRAITNFINWAAELGYSLPEATVNDDGSMQFTSTQSADAFHQAIIETSKSEQFL